MFQNLFQIRVNIHVSNYVSKSVEIPVKNETGIITDFITQYEKTADESKDYLKLLISNGLYLTGSTRGPSSVSSDNSINNFHKLLLIKYTS